MLVGPLLGYIYFVRADGLDAVKIGYSKSPWARLDNLRTASPVGLRMLWLFKGTRAVEAYLHSQFQNYRVIGNPPIGGEWFKLSSVCDGFRYYGQDPAALFLVANRSLAVSGVLPRGLLPPEGAPQEGLTEMEISLQRRTAQSQARQAERSRRAEEINQKRIWKGQQREARKKAWSLRHSSRSTSKVVKFSVGDQVGWLTVLAVGEVLRCRCRCGFIVYKTKKALRSASGRSCNECRGLERASRKKTS